MTQNSKSKYLIANWKMNPGNEDDAIELASAAEKSLDGLSAVETIICPPSIYLSAVRSVVRNSYLGAQDISIFEEGAYTGQISGNQLKNSGVEYVIVGHSEYRTHLQHANSDINKKIQACIRSGIIPILCVGADLKIEDSIPRIKSILRRQLTEALDGVDVKQILIAYEPTWAISSAQSGKQPDEEHVQVIYNFLKDTASNLDIYDFSILYGGSINSHNVSIFKIADGYLVGSASLNAEEFGNIARKISSF